MDYEIVKFCNQLGEQRWGIESVKESKERRFYGRDPFGGMPRFFSENSDFRCFEEPILFKNRKKAERTIAKIQKANLRADRKKEKRRLREFRKDYCA